MTKRLKITVLTLFVSTLFISACCKAAYPTVNVIIENSLNTNLLNTAQTTDSTWTWNEPEEFMHPLEIISTGEGSALQITLNGIESGQDYQIKLNNSDVDTLNIVYEIKGRNCNLNA